MEYLLRQTYPALQLGGWFLQQRADFLHETQPIRDRKRCAAIFLVACFAMELFNVNFQDAVKSGEKQVAANALGTLTPS